MFPALRTNENFAEVCLAIRTGERMFFSKQRGPPGSSWGNNFSPTQTPQFLC